MAKKSKQQGIYAPSKLKRVTLQELGEAVMGHADFVDRIRDWLLALQDFDQQILETSPEDWDDTNGDLGGTQEDAKVRQIRTTVLLQILECHPDNGAVKRAVVEALSLGEYLARLEGRPLERFVKQYQANAEHCHEMSKKERKDIGVTAEEMLAATEKLVNEGKGVTEAAKILSDRYADLERLHYKTIMARCEKQDPQKWEELKRKRK